MFSSLSITNLLIKLLVLITALPMHEAAHAWAASKLGDNTARNQGRITLNPMKHLDLFGSLAMIVVGFGWAKPVQINPRNFKNPKVGMALSSLAGPMSNVLLAFILMVIFRVLLFFNLDIGSFYDVLIIMMSLNIGLAVFNLLPIPPLDGSRIATLFLSQRTYFKIMQYEQYIFIGLFVLIYTGILSKPLMFLINLLYEILMNLTSFVEPVLRLVT